MTATAGVNVCPAVVVVGSPVTSSATAVPGVMSNVELVVPVTPPVAASSVYPVPTESIVTLENVAMPVTADTAAVPPMLALAVPLPLDIVRVTLPVNPVAIKLRSW